jgi:signal transduction histidine kinase
MTISESAITADQRGPVPPGVDLSAYRIVQEALTNVIKHAAVSSANVTISYRPDSLTVEITGGRAPAASCSRTPRPTTCWPGSGSWRRATPCSRRA